ncbi:hypothetical protein D046_3748, partial [Vibrio parahaemolyticus V-223/04]
LKPVTTR